MVTMYDLGDGRSCPIEQWTVHFFKWLCMRMLKTWLVPAAHRPTLFLLGLVRNNDNRQALRNNDNGNRQA